jgi:hypothetical protein
MVAIFIALSSSCQKVIRTKTFPQLAQATNGISQLGYFLEDLEMKGSAIPLSLEQMFALYPETKKLGLKQQDWTYEYKSGVGLRMQSLVSFDGYYLERRFDGTVEKTKERRLGGK